MLASIADSYGFTRCFLPRHRIEMRHENHALDMLICFECRYMTLSRDGKDAGRVYLGPNTVLSELLLTHGIPISEPEW